jgi:molybdopterin synthase catalytic subunit
VTVIHAAVTSDPLDVSALLGRVGAPEDGAVLLFLGIVRNNNDGRRVERIVYEGYEPMARELLEVLATTAMERFGLSRVAVEHRLGQLRVGEASVALAISSPHRAAAYDASRWLMAELKRTIPVWKEEGFVEGDRGWVPGTDPRLPPEEGVES